MKKYLPIVLVSVLLVLLGYVAISKKSIKNTENTLDATIDIGEFAKPRSCARVPQFLRKMGATSPIIDLSQERYKGIAFILGKERNKVLHPKIWERFENFSTYALDESGNIYLAPMPYISIKPSTFNLQKNLYKLDSKTGKIAIWKHFDDVKPDGTNPFGIISLDYDCDDQTLWVSAIDETDYRNQRGVIYHIDVKSQQIMQKIEGFDALTLRLLHTTKGKYLLAGSAKESKLYAFEIKDGKLLENPIPLFTLVNTQAFIRKIKIKGKNRLAIETIPFSYTLIAQTAKRNRNPYTVQWNPEKKSWKLTKKGYEK